MTIDALKNKLPEVANDLRRNLEDVLSAERLTVAQTLGAALASAYYVGADELVEALMEEFSAHGLGDDLIEDAQAAASLMAMNTVYYRFRGMIGKEAYSKLPARLRMQRLVKPATDKPTIELMAMAIAALAGCEHCMQAHEAGLLKHGMTVEHVHDAVRIGAVIDGVATALRMV